ncbi:MAG: DUF4160 domain-containing protein [Parolsenella sp.]|uniref:DUF4160 domain-containing protein n=1 Tax=Parolsenella sp. TaxID=2083006 RepID=UPI002A74F945|nr:DUF4160 domain-containing protein [Parolsenella sp.]MCI5949328.1 DUF4160 domain-containing protein [Coriobacteriaceae bacterium]MDY3292055.1 DUF4160 domain-containing protein [Parolsenella sp.]
MPKVLVVGRYVLFFWVSENGEPVHVHVAVRHPEKNSTKFWLTSSGGCILANNSSSIPEKDLRNLAKVIKFNHGFICERWMETFGRDSLGFYL